MAPALMPSMGRMLESARAQSPFDAQGNFVGGGIYNPDGSFRPGGIPVMPEMQRRIDLANAFYNPDTGEYVGDPEAVPLGPKLTLLAFGALAGVPAAVGGGALGLSAPVAAPGATALSRVPTPAQASGDVTMIAPTAEQADVPDLAPAYESAGTWRMS